MRICIVGGIFDKPADYRARHSISPETVLADGLTERGCRVTRAGHAEGLPSGDFDLIHVHHFGRAALRLAASPKRPLWVLTTHDPFAMNGLAVSWRRRISDGFVLRKADRVVALSKTERDFLVEGRGLAADRIAVIPNDINTAVFDRTAGAAASGNDLLFVGQLQQFKGLDYLLDAMPAVRTFNPAIKLRVVYQTDTLLGHYQAQAARLGLNGCVEFAGAKTAPALAQLYSTATMLISPSLGECLSTVVLEAMCCGAAVIATDVGGIREQLDENTGVIVPPRDSASLARAICLLLADGARRRKLGDAARRKARAQFGVRQMIDRHMLLYQQILKTHECAA